ncbi:MAG: hypothetical protein GY798_00640 [Hyphomicrobiales bacterium]|nr:hypothetical protein [Hyphomicrobiales bacterium]
MYALRYVFGSLLLAMATLPGHATIVVNSVEDANTDSNRIACQKGVPHLNKFCTLRAAVTLVNKGVDFRLTLLRGEYEIEAGPIPISAKRITIDGKGDGQRETTLSCGFESAAFTVQSGARLVLRHLRIEECQPLVNDGGLELILVFLKGDLLKLRNAIWNSGDLLVDQSTIVGFNSDIEGGAILNKNEGKVTITHSRITGNTAPFGGAISSRSGTLAIDSSYFESNAAFAASGGAISTRGNTITTIRDVSFRGNRATKNGGAFASSGSADGTFERVSFFSNAALAGSGGALSLFNGSHEITNATFGENDAAYDGGAIWAGPPINNQWVSVQFSTVVDNHAGKLGGGIHAPAKLRIGNSVVARNTAGGNPDCGPDLHSVGNNIFGVIDGCLDETSDLTGTASAPFNPGLGTKIEYDPAAVHGASVEQFFDPVTNKMALYEPLPPSSPVLGGGVTCVSEDQRKVSRLPATESGCDIGAIEIKKK